MKLVRDNIPEIIEAAGNWCLTRTVTGYKEHMEMLGNKIVEESQEFIERPSLEEAGDMLEVILALCEINDLNFEDVIVAAKMKRDLRGGFRNGIILQEVKNQ